MTKKDEKICLYKTIAKENNNRIINLKDFCKHNDIALLYEEDKDMFPSDEQAYFIVYPDSKACIVIDKNIPKERQKEIGFYSAFKIIKYRINNELDPSMHKFYDNKVMASFYSDEDYSWNLKRVDNLCLRMTEEALLPSKMIPIDIYKYINTKKIKKLADLFEISPEIVEKRCQWLIGKSKEFLEELNPLN